MLKKGRITTCPHTRAGERSWALKGLGGWEEGQREVSVSTGDDSAKGIMWVKAEAFTLVGILVIIMIITVISVNVF